MTLIKDGNLKRGVRIALIIFGIGLIYISVNLISPPSIWGIIFLIIGVFLTAVGGYASRAAMLNIRPFDQSYKEARKSYRQESESERND